jgi:hypothetical protein
VGVINCFLSFGFPSVVSSGVVWEHTDDMDVIDVLECVLGGVNELAAKDEVQALCLRVAPVVRGLWGPIGDGSG